MDILRPHLYLVDLDAPSPLATVPSEGTHDSLRFLAPGEYHHYVNELLDSTVRRLPTRNDDPPPLAA